MTIKSWPAVMGFSPHTAMLIDVLSQGVPGKKLTDIELSEIADVDCKVEGRGRAYVRSAIRYVRKNHHICWQRDVGQAAIRCLNPDERIESATSIRHSAGRVINKAIQTVPLLEDVAPEKRSEVMALSATLGTLRLFSRADTQAKMLKEHIVAVPELKKLLESFPKE